MLRSGTLADLAVAIERLTAEEHRIARSMIARNLETIDRADIGLGNRGPGDRKAATLDRQGPGKAAVDGADVRGIALRRTQPTPVARPLAEIPAESERAAFETSRQENAVLSAKNGTTALLNGWAGRKKPWTADTASPGAVSSSGGLVARVAPGRIDGGQALIPTIETIGFTTDGSGPGDRPKIEIAARAGQRVAAPNDGRVAFAGDFRSYGLLLIIEHGNGYHTLLWGFSLLDIELGDTVRAGQIVGIVKDGPSPKLHLELRRNGQPVSPEVWLAASNSGVKG